MPFTNTCFICEAPFATKIRAQVYCTTECRAIGESRFDIPVATNQRRYLVLARDRFRCVYCGKGSSNCKQLHVDHVFPVSAGGGDEIINLVTSCVDCNVGKGSRVLNQVQIEEIWQRNLYKARNSIEYAKAVIKFLSKELEVDPI